MSNRDYYQVLGIPHDAPAAAVRAAYARLARLHHPDLAGELPERLRDVQEAYRCLSDPDTRARHDRMIADLERAHVARQHALQRRLHGYDRRHPRAAPRYPRRVVQRSLLALVAMATAGVRAIGAIWRRNRST